MRVRRTWAIVGVVATLGVAGPAGLAVTAAGDSGPVPAGDAVTLTPARDVLTPGEEKRTGSAPAVMDASATPESQPPVPESQPPAPESQPVAVQPPPPRLVPTAPAVEVVAGSASSPDGPSSADSAG